MRTAVVTGASTGIGYATVGALTARGVQVFAGVRRESDGQRLRSAFGSGVTPVDLDVTHASKVSRAAQTVRTALDGRRLFGLVNNAGIAQGGPLLHQPIAELEQQLRVNLIGAVRMIQAFAPLLGADPALHGPPGRIVNMSSTAGGVALPFLSAYSASKHGLEGLSDSLRTELLPYGIDVIVLQPGPVVTPIFDKAREADISAYANTIYARPLMAFRAIMLSEGRRGLAPEHIGEAVYQALSASSPKHRQAIVPRRLANWTLPRLLPRRWLDRMIQRKIGLTGDIAP